MKDAKRLVGNCLVSDIADIVLGARILRLNGVVVFAGAMGV